MSFPLAQLNPNDTISLGERVYLATEGSFEYERLLSWSEDVWQIAVRDRSSRESVIITAIPFERLSAGRRLRLIQETARMPGASSPHAQTLQEVAESQEALWLVWTCVEGQDLQQRLSKSPLPLDDALALGEQLFTGLEFYHRLGIRHREIRPPHLIETEQGWKIINFNGLPAQQHALVAADDRLLASYYLSPEQAGSTPHHIGAPADLYQAGVVLYECLAGVRPFRGDTVGDLLFAHMTAPVPQLARSGLPCILDEVLDRLLRKDPRERYQSAESVAKDLQRIRHGLQRGVTQPRLTLDTLDRGTLIVEPAFVGRQAELGRLDECIRRSRDGRGGLATIGCVSGGGKTRLLQEGAHRAEQQGALVLWGDGATDVPQEPLLILTGVFRGLVSSIATRPELRDRILTPMDAIDRETLARLPGLERIFGQVLGPKSATEFGEQQTLRALMHLIHSLGTPDRPAVIFLDDCQWADEFTLKFLRMWSRDATVRASHGTCHTTLLAAYRSEELPPQHSLRTMPTMDALTLVPMSAADVGLLVRSMAEGLPRDVVALVCQLAEGSPFMATATLRGMAESARWR